jgi:hypothetical protein
VVAPPRLGPLIAGLGFVYSVTSLNAAGAPLAYTIGMVVWAGYIVFTGYVFLCFPRGWLESTLERRFMLAFVFSTAVVWALILPRSSTLPAGSDFTNCGAACPHNALQIVSGDARTGKGLVVASDIVFTAAALAVAMFVFHKARSPAQLRRRVVTPLAVVVIVQVFEFVLSLFPFGLSGDQGDAQGPERSHLRGDSRRDVRGPGPRRHLRRGAAEPDRRAWQR